MFERIDYSTGLYYFLSSLAQSAAAFAALGAVFATFRLQINGTLLHNLHYEMAVWLKNHSYAVLSIESLPHADDILRILQEIADGKKTPYEQKHPAIAKWFVDEYDNEKKIPQVLALKLGRPLILWGCLFLASLVALPLLEIDSVRIRGIVMLVCVVLSIGTFITLWLTKKFVQECLTSKKRPS